MNEFLALKRQKRHWKTAFLSELILLILGILLCIPPGIAQKNPLVFYNELFKKPPVFPVSYFIHNPEYPIARITPSDNRITSINRNNREVIVVFNQPMSTSLDNIVRNINMTYHDDLGKLEFRPYWKNAVTLSFRFNRTLARGEKIAFAVFLSGQQGRMVKPLVLQYR